MLVALHPLVTLHLYFTLRKTTSAADQRYSPRSDTSGQSDIEPTLQSRTGCAVSDGLFSFPLILVKEKHQNIQFWHSLDCEQMLLL